MTTHLKTKTTIQDLADMAGVAKSTVSIVLNNRKFGTRVGKETREKILQIAKDMNYTPQASARSLSMGKTYHIGYLVSSKIEMGLTNSYFSLIMAGVQQACQAQGYNCTVSTYDLSTIENFVMPPKLQQRSVDGVVITGYVESKVIEKFLEHQIPFVLVGDQTDFPLHGILSVARDMVTNWVVMLEHLAGYGHRRIVVPGYSEPRSLELMDQGLDKFHQLHPDISLTIDAPFNEQIGDNLFKLGFAAAEEWAKSDPATRSTALVSNDQWCAGFLSGIQRSGLNCPDDVSILANTNTPLCEWFNPAITAVEMGVYDCGQEATNMLVDLLEHRISLADAYRRSAASWTPGKLVSRASTGPVPIAK